MVLRLAVAEAGAAFEVDEVGEVCGRGFGRVDGALIFADESAEEGDTGSGGGVVVV